MMSALSRWPPSKRRTVLIYPEGLVVAHVLDLHRMTRKARRLGFGSGRRLVCIGEGALYPGCEKVNLRLHHKRLGFYGECAAHDTSPQIPDGAKSQCGVPTPANAISERALRKTDRSRSADRVASPGLAVRMRRSRH